MEELMNVVGFDVGTYEEEAIMIRFHLLPAGEMDTSKSALSPALVIHQVFARALFARMSEELAHLPPTDSSGGMKTPTSRH